MSSLFSKDFGLREEDKSLSDLNKKQLRIKTHNELIIKFLCSIEQKKSQIKEIQESIEKIQCDVNNHLEGLAEEHRKK